MEKKATFSDIQQNLNHFIILIILSLLFAFFLCLPTAQDC